MNQDFFWVRGRQVTQYAPHVILSRNRDADGSYWGEINVCGTISFTVREDGDRWVAHSNGFPAARSATREDAIALLCEDINPTPEIAEIYESGGDASDMFSRLRQCGVGGLLAIELFRACKASKLGKSSPRFLSYDEYGERQHGPAGEHYSAKNDAIANVCKLLRKTDYMWGWGFDERQPVYRHVLYLEIPTGQVSFHAGRRGTGPEQPKPWDGVENVSHRRVLVWIGQLIGAT